MQLKKHICKAPFKSKQPSINLYEQMTEIALHMCGAVVLTDNHTYKPCIQHSYINQ